MIANHLTPSPGWDYASAVPEKKGNWFGDLIYSRRMLRLLAVFFRPLPSCASLWRAWAGMPSGMPVSLSTGSPTLSCARHPHLAMRSGFITATQGGLHA